ncbi:MAG: diadenylate cyclase, partial [Ilumatobacter sp.]
QRATVADLSEVDGIDSNTAAEVRETLTRVTETAILDQYN